MSCPPKFKDLHKSADDAFSKDFHTECYNNKLKSNYTCGDYGFGSMTQKLNFNTATQKPSAEIEFKHTMGDVYGRFMEGMTVTKTIASGADSCKVKYEKNCKSSGGKCTLEYNQGIGMGGNMMKLSKPSLTFDLGKDKFTSQLNIKPQDSFMGVDSATFNTVMAAGPAHLGFSAGYGFKDSKVSHAIKFSKNANGLNLALGLANANDVELVMSKNCNKNVNLGLCSFDITNVHSKSQYSVNNGNWGSQLAIEHDNCKVGSLALTKGKIKVDLKTLDYAERGTIKVNDNIDFSFGAKSNLSGSFFDNFKLGAAVDFSA